MREGEGGIARVGESKRERGGESKREREEEGGGERHICKYIFLPSLLPSAFWHLNTVLCFGKGNKDHTNRAH